MLKPYECPECGGRLADDGYDSLQCQDCPRSQLWPNEDTSNWIQRGNCLVPPITARGMDWFNALTPDARRRWLDLTADFKGASPSPSEAYFFRCAVLGVEP